MRACVRARARVRACVRACVRVCVCVSLCIYIYIKACYRNMSVPAVNALLSMVGNQPLSVLVVNQKVNGNWHVSVPAVYGLIVRVACTQG